MALERLRMEVESLDRNKDFVGLLNRCADLGQQTAAVRLLDQMKEQRLRVGHEHLPALYRLQRMNLSDNEVFVPAKRTLAPRRRIHKAVKGAKDRLNNVPSADVKRLQAHFERRFGGPGWRKMRSSGLVSEARQFRSEWTLAERKNAVKRAKLMK